MTQNLWQPALFVAASWVALAFAVRTQAVTERSDGYDGVHSITAGLGVPSTVLMSVAIAVAVLALAAWLTPQLAGSNAAAFARLAGKHLHPDWKVLLADTMLRRSQPVPPALEEVADALRAGRIQPPEKPLVTG